MAGVGDRPLQGMVRFVLLVLTVCAAGARGLYFHIGETEKRCFIEEIPDETMVIGNYRTQMWDKQKEVFLPSTPGLGMHVEVKDPDSKVVLSRQYGSEGRFTFTSHTPGDHQICLHSNSTRMALFAGGKLRVHLDIQVGEHANNYPEIAAKDKLTELQLRARQLLDQVEQIQKEQDYQRAVSDLGWSRPTLIQEKAIPLALEGKDLLARARTGSGKTAAYALPMLQLLLHKKATGPVMEQAVRGLVLVPTKELARQAQSMIQQLAAYCARDVRVANVSAAEDAASQRAVLMEKPDVVVGTPSRILNHLQQNNLTLRDSLELLVVDEADLLFSFGFEDELKSLLCHLPRIYQAFLMSATFNEDVQTLKELVLHNPVTLKLQESQLPGPDQLQQFQVVCETEEDKFLLLYALLKLSLIRGKALLFVNTLERGYRLRLFLEQFSIPSCVLNGELPLRSRCHIISQFNQGLYDCVIATDAEILGPQVKGKRRGRGSKGDKASDPESGVARGIDFHHVSAVLNFDLPPTAEAYVHRAGRTARANNPGIVLTFVLPTEQSSLGKIEELLSGEGEAPILLPYQFQMEEIESFRYRCRDAMRSVTKQAIREARLKEIKEELLHSEKLKTYFEDNPRDLQLLRHDLPLHPAVVKPHLGNVPDYLVPAALRGLVHPRKKRRKMPFSRKAKKVKTQNPLRDFKHRGKKPKPTAKSS